MDSKDERLIQLDNLFQFAPPTQLRRSITRVFFGFLIHGTEELPGDFNRTAEDFYFLIDFLEEMEN